MKLLTKLKLRLEGAIKSINLDWREVAVELNEDLLEERIRRFMCEREVYDLKQQLAIYKEKEQIEKGRTRAKSFHDVSHMIKDILDGKSVDEAMTRLEIKMKDEEVEQEDDQN